MEVSGGQHHAPAALYPRGNDPGTHCTGGWVGPRAGLNTEASGKFFRLCRRSNLERPVVQSVARLYILTELIHRLEQVVSESKNYKFSLEHYKC
jgi:hypothetical protein